MNNKRGFVTLATGDIRYYIMAVNLLHSYRLNSDNSVPFAIIAEEKNEYTEEFDLTVIIDNASHTYMDKIRMLQLCPFEENIFIDADCLVYRNINDLWQLFNERIGVLSAVGEELPLDSEDGWFKRDDVGEFSEKLSYIPHLHGGMYFIRKKPELEKIVATCKTITEQYHKYRFKMFNDPADEPIIALAMASNNLAMIPYQPDIMCFYPSATYFQSDIRNGTAQYLLPWNENLQKGYIVHWANFNTKRAMYKTEILRMNYSLGKNRHSELYVNLYYCFLTGIEKTKDSLFQLKNRTKSLLSKKHK